MKQYVITGIDSTVAPAELVKVAERTLGGLVAGKKVDVKVDHKHKQDGKVRVTVGEAESKKPA